MSLKAGWLALAIFVWIIGAFLGSTFEYQSEKTIAAGMSYSTGTANFTTNNVTVAGNGTTWNNVLMAGGRIKCNADGVWYKVLGVTDATHLSLTAVYSQNSSVNQAYTMEAIPGWAGTGTGGYATSPTSKLEYVLKVTNAVQGIELLGFIPFVAPNPDYFKAVYEIITWQWSFMDGYGMVYWILFAPFVVMGALSLILLVYGILTGNLSF